MVQIPQGKHLRVVSVLERADENGDTEVRKQTWVSSTGHPSLLKQGSVEYECRVMHRWGAVLLRGTGCNSAFS